MSIAILAVFLLMPSMVNAAEETHCSYMMVLPTALSLGPGNTADVTVIVLDKEKKPIEKHLITVNNDHPDLVRVEPTQAMTDKDGKAVFRFSGTGDIEASPLNVNFNCKEHEVSVLTGG